VYVNIGYMLELLKQVLFFLRQKIIENREKWDKTAMGDVTFTACGG